MVPLFKRHGCLTPMRMGGIPQQVFGTNNFGDGPVSNVALPFSLH